MNFPWEQVLGGLHAQQDAAEGQAKAETAARSAAIRQAAGPAVLDALTTGLGREREDMVWDGSGWRAARTTLRKR